MPHEHKVEDTRKRSILKALTGYLLESIIDTFIFGTLLSIIGIDFPHAYSLGFGFSILTEGICFLIHYLNDRSWNRTQWGRKVIDMEKEQKIERSCHFCIWRRYPGSLMMCDHPIIRERMKTDPKCKTPCEYFEYDKTGMEYLERIKEGYSWIRESK